MREYNLGVLEVVEPIGLPLKRDKGIVIYRGESAHNVVDGHSSLADELIFTQ